jgi:hypothetical protein
MPTLSTEAGNYPLTVGTQNRRTSAWKLSYGSLGDKCWFWGPEVNRVRDEFLNCVFYVYPSAEDAHKAERRGGSGSLVQVELENNRERCIVYAVTNSHVIKRCGPLPAITINTKEGKRQVFTTANGDWRFLPNHDVAAVPVSFNSATHSVRHIGIDGVMTQELIAAQEVGPGDETFMIGRFVNHEGKEKNLPTVRFGNISMMPYEPIEDEYGVLQESFLVECRSVPGYSGSPVFLNIDFNKPRPSEASKAQVILGRATEQRLLGIDWAHINSYDEVFEKTGEGKRLKTNLVARSNTSMAAVVPAWRIAELLNIEEFREMRSQVDANVTNHKAQLAVAADSAGDDPQVFTQADFESALKKASKPTSSRPAPKKK